MSDNYNIYSTIDGVRWPEYVSRVELDGDYLEKAEHVLDMALVTLEAYGGPRFILHKLNRASRKCIYLYDISADLIDDTNNSQECNIFILYEPWMKANCIAQASFEFVNDESQSKIVVKRKQNVPYYKQDELLYEDGGPVSNIPRWVDYHTAL